ncbi:MAG: fibrobacter succinogenes major paralogous domain-containing protein [Bacteroidales bacterium]|nr:fibrobacter succinogenes major paralogous domain-containing protein [Bacteroidales bacterium]
MSYQAVVRNASGVLVKSNPVGMKISILQGSATGTAVYIETQTPTTNENGLVTLAIGGGTPITGTFAGINWSTDIYFIKTETDPTGGTSYTITGTNQILSVPYALYSKIAGNGPLWSQSNSNIYFNSGNVGIGISDPIYNLDVRGSNSDADGVIQLGNSDLSHRMILFGGRQNDPNPFISWKQGDPLRFATDEGGWSEKMRITSDGLVGIGTVAPTSMLDVKGEINVNSNKIVNVATPVNSQDAANKAYVDNLLSIIQTIQTGVRDVDSNTYKVILMGTQFWMAENLKTTRYGNGDLIGTTTPATRNISGDTSPMYQWAYGGNESNAATYGRLYTWYAITDSRNICPTGWHVPTGDEWRTLIMYLKGLDVAAGKLKETGTTHWTSPNTGATNETGFTALPGGYRNPSGTFSLIGDSGFLWTTTEYGATNAYSYYMSYSSNDLGVIHESKKSGYSVRCLKD